MKHIYACYNDWPIAFYEYLQEKIPQRMNTPEFDLLMKIEDPLAYLQNDENDFYKNRLSIPKYIISASGDDFFPPDCLNMYLDQLPGQTRIRLVPNQGHLIDMKIVEDALLSFYQTLLNRHHHPSIQWSVDHSGNICHVISDKKPSRVTLWQAENPEKRDFRLASQINYQAQELAGSYREEAHQYPVQVSRPSQGWKAHFVEFTFEDAGNLVLTTPAFVTGS